MGDTKHDLMVKTCDPTSLACQCDFTTEDGCEAETGECSCTVWDLIEDNAELEQQLAAANARAAELEKQENCCNHACECDLVKQRDEFGKRIAEALSIIKTWEGNDAGGFDELMSIKKVLGGGQGGEH